MNTLNQRRTNDGIKEIINQFKVGAENAKKAGFDGVELHGANGYLVNQFIKSGSNKRTDEYGGSIENRCRFALEAIDVLIGVFGADRVGIKVSPFGRYQDQFDEDPIATYSYLLQQLSNRKTLFVELMNSDAIMSGIEVDDQIKDFVKNNKNLWNAFRKQFTGVMVANFNLDKEKRNKLLTDGDADVVSFGKFFLADPDLFRFDFF